MKKIILFALAIALFSVSFASAADFTKEYAGITIDGMAYLNNQKCVVDVGHQNDTPILHFALPVTSMEYDQEMTLNTKGKWAGYWTKDTGKKPLGQVVISIRYGYTNSWFPQEVTNKTDIQQYPEGTKFNGVPMSIGHSNELGSNFFTYPANPF